MMLMYLMEQVLLQLPLLQLHKIPLNQVFMLQIKCSSKGKKRKGKLDDSVDVFLKTGFETITEALKEGNSILREVRPRVYSAEEVFAGLQNIGVEQPLLLKAYRFLNADARGVREFFGCPTEFRTTLLEDMMRDSYI
ncbi:hypothetical protein Droror1_Dr00027572 [Drosera rotundifolia]